MSDEPEPLPDEPTFFHDDPTRPMLMDRDGRPMGLASWSKAFQDTDGRLVARDFVGDREVRTMWHGTVGGDYLCGWSNNTEIFGSIICTRDPEDDQFKPDLSIGGERAWNSALRAARGRSVFGREILTGTVDAALAAHQELLDELRAEEEASDGPGV